MADDRKSDGTFALGNPGGPGRPRLAVEREYLTGFVEGVSRADWQAIIHKAVADAKAGNAKAREWLSKHLVGSDPIALVELREEFERLKAAMGVEDETGNDPTRNSRPAPDSAG